MKISTVRNFCKISSKIISLSVLLCICLFLIHITVSVWAEYKISKIKFAQEECIIREEMEIPRIGDEVESNGHTYTVIEVAERPDVRVEGGNVLEGNYYKIINYKSDIHKGLSEETLIKLEMVDNNFD